MKARSSSLTDGTTTSRLTSTLSENTMSAVSASRHNRRVRTDTYASFPAEPRPPGPRRRSVFDIGTGSGVTAILAVDISPAAVVAAAYNVEQSGVADRVEVPYRPFTRRGA